MIQQTKRALAGVLLLLQPPIVPGANAVAVTGVDLGAVAVAASKARSQARCQYLLIPANSASAAHSAPLFLPLFPALLLGRFAAPVPVMTCLTQTASRFASRISGVRIVDCANAKAAIFAGAHLRSPTIPATASASHGAPQTTTQTTVRDASVRLAISARRARRARRE